MTGFDTVLSMGVLYHRRSTMGHLVRLRGLLRPGGELVLETLAVDGGAGDVLGSPGCYARMRNVWSIPAVATLEPRVGDCGFRGVWVVDVTPTTTAEQRSSEWMRFESLARPWTRAIQPGRWRVCPPCGGR
jgi:tRNA (mo5U34)-methyltransferase